MACCIFMAQPSVCPGAAAASSALASSRFRSSSSRRRSSSDAGCSSHCFTPIRALASVPSRSSVSCGKQGRVGCSWGRMTSQERALAPPWSSLDYNRGDFSLLLRAKRKSRGEGDGIRQGEEELDEDMQVGLNEISTEALKAMLSEDDKEVAHVRQKVDYLGKYLVQEKQLDAARFMLILRGMLDHEVVPQKDDLKGAYKKAFDTIASVIEDSGWVLKQEGADVGGVEMVDDELMPPVLNSHY